MNRAARTLERLGLLRPAFRGYEWARSLRHRRNEGPGPDGLPMPPARLRMKVICRPGSEDFIESGRLAAETVRRELGEAGLDLERCGSILEFGCGCGRVLRSWRDLPARVAGSDYDAEQVRWCNGNLPFADVRRNGAVPPTEFGDGEFDLVYSLSVFIHIAPDLQAPWMGEMRRLLAPGGHLLLSTHGAAYRDQMTPEERGRFDRGEFVFRWPGAAGTSFSAGFHPDAYVRELAGDLELVRHTPGGALDTREDLYLFRRP